jgi:hypothetical protein
VANGRDGLTAGKEGHASGGRGSPTAGRGSLAMVGGWPEAEKVAVGGDI